MEFKKTEGIELKEHSIVVVDGYGHYASTRTIYYGVFHCVNYKYDLRNGYLTAFEPSEMELLKEDSLLIQKLKKEFMKDYKEEVKEQIENTSVSNGELLDSLEASITKCSQVINDINSYIENEYKELKKESIAELSNRLLELENL